MTSVSASGGRSPVRLCRIVPQTNDPPAWLKAGRAFSFLAALPPRSPRCFISTVRVQTPSSHPGFCSTGFWASVIVFPVIALQGRQIAFERPCRHPRTSRPEPSGEVRNCQPKPSNRFSGRSCFPRCVLRPDTAAALLPPSLLGLFFFICACKPRVYAQHRPRE